MQFSQSLTRQVAFGSAQRPSEDASDSSKYQGEVCIANIGPRERRRRLNFGLRVLALGIAIAAALVLLHVPTLWRLPLFVVFATGATSAFQWWEKT